MSYRIALNFEDGVTRIIDCGAQETLLDAAFRQQIKLPMDCADGVCGSCKCRAESGRYSLGDDYLDEALSADEAASGMVLSCQLRPQSDCVIAVPTRSNACNTASTELSAVVESVGQLGDAVYELVLALSAPMAFLPGQYVNLRIPGTAEHRAYSFSSVPGLSRASFLIKRVAGGSMSAYLDRARVGDRLTLSGPLGSFYLREPLRPLLMLAGGTGLAPILAMLRVLASQGCAQPVRLFYGVNRDVDLVKLDELTELGAQLADFSLLSCVADAHSRHPHRGFVTDHLRPDVFSGEAFDAYLCGPPPMVDGVRAHLQRIGLLPLGFYYEKFSPAAAMAAGAAA